MLDDCNKRIKSCSQNFTIAIWNPIKDMAYRKFEFCQGQNEVLKMMFFQIFIKGGAPSLFHLDLEGRDRLLLRLC